MKDKIAQGFDHFLQYDLGWTLLTMLVIAGVVFLVTADFGTNEKKRKYNAELYAYLRENQKE
jgi:hypothetical protein